MLLKSISALAALAFAANVAAEPVPYKAQLHKTSARQLFGAVRRQDNPGYQPELAVCGTGNTCEDACGAGYQTCASKDDSTHCYNPAASETCCPNGSGNSCDAGYYCAADKGDETWCCPDGMDLEACADAYGVKDGLVKQTVAPAPEPSTTSTTSSSTTSSSTSTSSSVATTSSALISSTKIFVPKNSTTSATSYKTTASISPSASFPASNSTSVAISVSATPTAAPTQSDVPKSGAVGVTGPAAGTLLLVVAGLAALL